MKEIIAIIAIAVVVITALICGHDGAVLMSGIGIIAGIGGYSLGTRKNKPSQIDEDTPKKN